ncbi:jg5187 [Pararge aegeria aegeria]|uniref:Jg5187 protein n=1 Tax=Pararge aegeria aegeria TaxID=348720 RepID=A0A8S4RZS8_9NEOP|nr:jg5187 [Pararge aegeria aegeria]
MVYLLPLLAVLNAVGHAMYVVERMGRGAGRFWIANRVLQTEASADHKLEDESSRKQGRTKRSSPAIKEDDVLMKRLAVV